MTDKNRQRMEKIEAAMAERERQGRVIEIVWVEDEREIGLFYRPDNANDDVPWVRLAD